MLNFTCQFARQEPPILWEESTGFQRPLEGPTFSQSTHSSTQAPLTVCLEKAPGVSEPPPKQAGRAFPCLHSGIF